MKADWSTVFCYLFCQVYNFLFCSLAGVWRSMEIYSVNFNATFCNHVSCYRAINAARKEKHGFSVYADRHSACTLDSLRIYINLVSDFHRESQIRFMYIYTCIREFIQNAAAQFCADFHGCDRIGFLCSSCIYFEASAVVWMTVLHIRNYVLCHLLESLILVDHYRADSDNTEYVLQSFYCLIIIILFRAEYINSSLFFLYFKLAFYFGKSDVHLLYKGILEHVSVLTFDGDFCVFYQKCVKYHLFLLLLFYGIAIIIICAHSVSALEVLRSELPGSNQLLRKYSPLKS